MRQLLILSAMFAASYPALAQDAPEQDAQGATYNGPMEDTLVIGRSQSLYQVQESSVSTRLDADLSRIPASVQIINEELMEDQGARDIRDLYRSISGVSVFSYSGVTFRGFRQDEVLYDGLRGDPYAGFAVPRLFGVERVEVLKGPSGAVYGAGAPGGLINYVTSQASLEQMARVQMLVGNYDLTGINFEANGAFGDSDLGYRVALLKETEDPFRYHTTNDNDQGDLGLVWAPSGTTRLNVKYSFVEQTLGANRLRGVPVDEDGDFLVDRGWNHNEPTDFLTLDADIFYSRLQHDFSPNLHLDIAARYYENQEKQNYHEPQGLIDPDGDGVLDMMTRQFRDQVRNSEGLGSYANLVYEFSTGGVEHQFLVGADYYREDSDFKAKRGAPQESGGVVPALSLYDPVYGQTSRAQYGLDAQPWDGSDASLRETGFYMQDLIALSEQWDVLASVRYNQFESGASDTEDDSDSAITYRLGAVYHWTENLNLYASYGEGFESQSPGNQDTRAGGPFDPEESTQWETGAKLNLWGGRAQVNMALYEIDRTNVLQSSPAGDVGNDGIDDLVALGRVRSRGAELDLSADLLRQWTMTLNYGYNRTRVLEATSGITNATGDRFANTPEHQLGLWTRYDFLSINSALAFGAQYKADQISIDGRPVKSYAIFDLSWQTDFDLWKLQLNVNNLFDKEYAESGFIRRAGHFPGEPRRVIVTLSREM